MSAAEAQWECRCYDGWDGPDCGVPLEQNCADNKDNDKGNAAAAVPDYEINTISKGNSAVTNSLAFSPYS